jgi:two-component system CheB/CheR fusion protein
LFHQDRELPPDQHPLARSGRTGEIVPGFEARVLRTNGSTVDVMMSATPLLDDNGKARGAIAAVVDISQRKRAEAHQEILLHELQHRVKNVLATVNSLAGRMLKSSASKEEFAAAFLGRLSAMGDMHELLSRRKWEGADLGAVARAALAPYASLDKGNIQLGGPDILLAPGVATTLGMAFHELATNAAKFGALSSPKGHAKVVWQIIDRPEGKRLSVTWAERGGPAVMAPEKDGFGTYFVKRSIEYELDGTAQIAFEPDGVRCVVEIPLSPAADNGSPIGLVRESLHQ